MKWGVNISLLMAVSGMIGVRLELVTLVESLDPDFDVPVSYLWMCVAAIAANASGAFAAACNGVGFFRQWRGAPMSRMLHLSNRLFLLIYLPVLSFYLVMLYADLTPEHAPLIHLTALAALVPFAGITAVYAALLRRQRALRMAASTSGLPAS
ncbi:MAG: hypothetical protein Q8J92_11570 [Parvibaculum sp.]|nr:hypothetical protein [Parvibaculum sp.]